MQAVVSKAAECAEMEWVMKNKLYYVLFGLYFVMVGFILYINGVFTGKVLSWSNVLINVIFLLIIGVLFVISFISFGRLNSCTDVLAKAGELMQKEYSIKGGCLWEEYRDRKKVFDNPLLEEAFDRYRTRLKGYEKGNRMTNTCDLDEYINEDLLDEIGMTHFNGSIAGTLTGLGILGTFIGLSLGLNSFNGNDIYTISDNVGPLLEGMKVAFHTSVYGIFFSLIFNVAYRAVMADAYEKLSHFQMVFRECVMPQVSTTDENSAVMLVYQANMANAMKSVVELLKGRAAEHTQGVEQMVRQFTEELTKTMGADFEKLGWTLNSVAESQQTGADNCRELEMTARELLAANRAILDAFGQISSRQDEFARELETQRKLLADTCKNLDQEIGSQLYTFQQMKSLERR